MLAFKTLRSHERGEVWHQFIKVTKEGSYYRVKCNLYSDEEIFIQGRLKTMLYHLWTKQKVFTLRFWAMSRSFTYQIQAHQRYHQHLHSEQLQTTIPSQNSKPETKKKRVCLESWVEKSMTKNEVEVFDSRLIEMVADSNMPFEWIDQKSTKRFLAACKLTILKHLPSSKRLSGPILRKAATASVHDILSKVMFLLTLRISVKQN